MRRADNEYAIRYSHRLERMTAIYWGRLDKVVTFVQLCLGASAFTDLANLKLIGATLAASSVWTFVFQPGAKAALAEQQKQQYESLCVRMSLLSDEELAESLAKVQEKDCSELGGLARAAEYFESMKLGVIPKVGLSWQDRLIAWIAGDSPRN